MVTQILKKGRKEDPGNYWLVNLISIPGNIRQQIMETISRQKKKKTIRRIQHRLTK